MTTECDRLHCGDPIGPCDTCPRAVVAQAPVYGPALPDKFQLGWMAGLIPADHPQLWSRADLLRRLNTPH